MIAKLKAIIITFYHINILCSYLIFMKIPFYIIILLITAGGVSIGTVYAVQVFNENVIVNGDLKVTTGSATVDRPSATSAIVVQNAGDFENVIKFNHYAAGEGQIFQFRQTPQGDRLDVADITHNRNIIAMSATNGYVGIGNSVLSPTEQLDVGGNIKLSGSIKSPGTLKLIPASGDVCIGSGC
jgi:hypothetical protein